MNINVVPLTMYEITCIIINAEHCSELKEILSVDPEFISVNCPDKTTIRFLCRNKNYCTKVVKDFEKRKVNEVLGNLRAQNGIKVPKAPEKP